MFPKLSWTTVRKKCPGDREKLSNFEAEGWECAKFLRSLEQFILTGKGQNNFFNLFLEVSYIIYNYVQIKLEKISVLERKNLLQYWYWNWTLVSVPDTETWFRLHANKKLAWNLLLVILQSPIFFFHIAEGANEAQIMKTQYKFAT